jgi:4-amino-4-deoxy-L-arabinose transferase-like glycosyltransferase
MWYDELSTFHLSFSPSWSGIFVALGNGADVMPPFYFICVKIAGFFIGHNELAVRLPAIIGFWMFLIVVYMYLSRKAGAIVGWLGILFGLLNLEFAVEGRPYALALGLSAGAYAAWMLATEGKRVKLMKSLMFLCLFLAFLTHYYASIIFVPLFVAEVWRIIRQPTSDKTIILAMLGSASAYLVGAPFILAAREFSSHFWNHPDVSMVGLSYRYFLGKEFFVWVMRIFFLAALVGHIVWFFSATKKITNKIASHEKIALGLVLLVPIFIYCMSFVTHAFTERYAMITVLGLALALPLYISYIFKNNFYLMLVVCVLLVYVNGRVLHEYLRFNMNYTMTIQTCLSELATLPLQDHVPIAVTEAHLFTDLYHYASPSLQQRLVYVTDIDNEIRYKGFDSDYRTLTGAAKVYPLPIVDTTNFLNTTKEFYILGNPNWILPSSRNLLLKDHTARLIPTQFCTL